MLNEVLRECQAERLGGTARSAGLDIEKRIGEKQIKIRQMYDLSLDRKKFFKI